VYAVLDWSTAAGAASAGVLTGIIVFVVVPALGLLAYWLVLLRRTHWNDEGKARPVIGATALSCGGGAESELAAQAGSDGAVSPHGMQTGHSTSEGDVAA
jgi:hypothetical protein